jgi:hypothetical protein
MRRIYIVLTVFSTFLQSFNSTAQLSDENFMRDYVAPDFKLRQLSVNGRSSGDGFKTELDEQYQFSLGANLNFSKISNNQKYQGTINSAFGFSTNYSSSSISPQVLSINASLQNKMINRFYFNDKWFWGAHDNSFLGLAYAHPFSDTLTGIGTYLMNFRPAVSIGFGRVEWVQFARQALDIERSLFQSKRLDESYTEQDRKLVADKIAQIRNRRYYDFRIGRIDQLQALDSLYAKEGLTNNADIIYFSELQDAYFFSYYTDRLSGFRHELGVVEGIDYSEVNGLTGSETFGFYSFSYFLPQSYAIQHNFELSVMGGIDANLLSSTSDYPVWADVNYTFGLYPTTRTYLGLTTTAGFNYDVHAGYICGLSLDTYYYISPRLRFSARAGFQQGDNYFSHSYDHVAVLNNTRATKEFDFNFNAGLSFEIF